MTINDRIIEMGGLEDGDLVLVNVGPGAFVIQGAETVWAEHVPVHRINQQITINGTEYRVLAFAVLDRAYPDFGSVWLLEPEHKHGTLTNKTPHGSEVIITGS